MTAYKTIGFIGLGVMGEPICRNLVRKSGARVIAFDLTGEPLARLKAEGVGVAASVAGLDRRKRHPVPVPSQCCACTRRVRR